MQEYKLLKAISKETNKATQVKYTGDVGIFAMNDCYLMFVPTCESKGNGFITSRVLDRNIIDGVYVFETLNSIYYFEKVGE